MINKKNLTETDVITKFILPSMKEADWADMPQIHQELKLHDGKIVVCGQIATRKKVKSADILLCLKPRTVQKRIVAIIDELTTLCDQLKSSQHQAVQTRLRLADALVYRAL